MAAMMKYMNDPAFLAVSRTAPLPPPDGPEVAASMAAVLLARAGEAGGCGGFGARAPNRLARAHPTLALSPCRTPPPQKIGSKMGDVEGLVGGGDAAPPPPPPPAEINSILDAAK